MRGGDEGGVGGGEAGSNCGGGGGGGSCNCRGTSGGILQTAFMLKMGRGALL